MKTHSSYPEPVRVCDKCFLKIQRNESGGRVSSGGLKFVVLGNSSAGKVFIIVFITPNSDSSHFSIHFGNISRDLDTNDGVRRKNVSDQRANFLSKAVMTADGRSAKLQIWDTAGAEKVSFYFILSFLVLRNGQDVLCRMFCLSYCVRSNSKGWTPRS